MRPLTVDDERVPWSVREFLEKEPRDYTHRDWEYHEALQLDACESVEAEESKWSGIFSQMARERPVHHYSDGTSG